MKRSPQRQEPALSKPDEPSHGNAEYPWTKFDAEAYFSHYYRELHADDIEVIQRTVEALKNAKPRGEKLNVLDVGTGGGVPGVILAIVRPDLRIELCDSVGKKARAVTSILADLGLQLPVHASAAQEVLRTSRFDTLVIRAVAPLAKVLTWFAPHWRSIGRLLIIKGPAWVEERHVAREKGLLGQLSLRKVAAYPLPGTQSESVILSIAPKPNQGAAP